MKRTGPRSYLGVPIIAGDRTLGVVSVQSYTKNVFNEDHVRLLQGLSSSMGVAIANAYLFDETQRLLKVAQDRAKELAILNSVGEAMTKSLNVDTVIRLVGDKVRQAFGTEVQRDSIARRSVWSGSRRLTPTTGVTRPSSRSHSG
ncbi:GAF domain-containing protein [Mesorhizobium atlanticum]